jgi:pimeloyl-ACP methyl ester carboxylesterase
VSSQVEFVDIDWDGRRVSIEYQWLGTADATRPLVLFLHEGLGSLAMWKDFPARLCAAAGCRGLVYSRPGSGRSTPRDAGERWGVDYLHRQACAVLPAVLDALEVDSERNPPWLLGHSDGGSIALIYAARHPHQVAGLILMSPHILVEDLSISSIEKARAAYLDSDVTEFKHKLGRYHDDPDSAFWGWNEIWLAPAFRDWNIEDEISAISCPLLAVQGLDDEYGTLEQIHGIQRRLPWTRIVELADCGHSPHRDQEETLIAQVVNFIAAESASAGADQRTVSL